MFGGKKECVQNKQSLPFLLNHRKNDDYEQVSFSWIAMLRHVN
jgi:hypothetical protein